MELEREKILHLLRFALPLETTENRIQEIANAYIKEYKELLSTYPKESICLECESEVKQGDNICPQCYLSEVHL